MRGVGIRHLELFKYFENASVTSWKGGIELGIAKVTRMVAADGFWVQSCKS